MAEAVGAHLMRCGMIRTKYTRMTLCRRGRAKGSIVLRVQGERCGEDFIDRGDGRLDEHNLGFIGRVFRNGLLKLGYQPVAYCRHADCPNAQRLQVTAQDESGTVRGGKAEER